MFRTLVEHTSRFSAIFPFSTALPSILRGGAILVAAVMALLLALMFAPSSTRANLALCLASQSESHSEHGKTDSHAATSLAIQQCID
ncbi:hypothetical protein LMG27952_05348 [Paraburkholderia hiiakae]|uniref:Uncharacterized protein n=1 Tax=Paraburkholderia hiiakae TaxID=1081782 RepID=A0ABM8P106_9BURK|nr:hypothetical protein LMG27952_05348 [Paraburkholderia hiiakae]